MSERVNKADMACNKPRRTPGHPKKSHVVKACFDGKEKVIRFGEQGASTAGKPKEGESERMKTKRASFKARHAKNIAKGPSSPAYWANKVKWAEGGEVRLARGGNAAMALLEQMKRAGAQSQEFDPVLASTREQQRARPAPRSAQRPAPQAAPMPEMREAPLPLPPIPPSMRPDENPPPEAPRNPMRFDEGNPHVATAIQMAERYGLPRDIFLSLVQQESGFDPNARSRRGAIGLGQLMPGTARELGVDPTDPVQNLEGSARYLRQMLDRFGDMPLALAAYNAGPGRVARAGNTIPNIRETQRYVPSILRRAGASVPEGFAEGGLAELEQKYAEGGRVGRVVGAVRRAVTRRAPEPEASEQLAPVTERATRSIMPAPQRFFDPADRAYKPFLRDFEPEPGGRYLEMRRGEAPRDVTGESVEAARIAVGPDGRPSMMVGDVTDLPTGSPGRGSTTTKTNLFKRSAGWNWTNAPEGYADIPTLVSVENRGNHYYALSAEFPKGVDLTRYADAPSEPRLRPTTQGNVYLGNQVGTISVRGKEHPVYDTLIVRQLAPAGAIGASAATAMPDNEPGRSLEDLDRKYAEGGAVSDEDAEYDRRLLSRMKAQTGRVTEPTRAEQMQALREVGRSAAEGLADVLLPQSPLDFALMAALGPGGRAARLAGSAALASLEPSEAEASRLRRLIRAYHGSPHKFDEFDIRKIGTGEGAQAYGRGLYFAENEDIAKHYRDTLSGSSPELKEIYARYATPDGQLYVGRGGDAQTYSDPKWLLNDATRYSEIMRDLPEDLQLAIRNHVSPGHMYEVDLNASPRDFLNWDAPLSQQSREVQESLQRFGLRADPDAARAYDDALLDALYNDPSRPLPPAPRDPTGEDIYQRALRMSPEEARVALMEVGIPGTRYLDAGSRGIGGTYNYAVFDPEIIDIRRRYAEGGLAELEKKYAEGGEVSAIAYDGDLVDALVKEIEAEYV